MRESKMLKVTGIIMIVGGGLMLLLSLFAFAGGALASATETEGGGLLVFAGVVGLVIGAIELIAGIMGAKNWNKPEKANACFIMGIVLIALSLLNNIITGVTSGFNASMISGIVIGLVLPVLYTYGASQLKKSA